MKKQRIIIAGFIISLVIIALVSFIGCDSGGGGGGPTSPGGTSNLQGQILKEPNVQIASSESLLGRFWAILGTGEAWAVSNQPIPVTNMKVDLSVNGRSMGTMTTDNFGRFRFDGMPSGMFQLNMMSKGGSSFSHDMSMGMGQTTSAYCVMWVDGSTVQMTCTDQSGDHWDDMMRGVPASQWDMGKHRMKM